MAKLTDEDIMSVINNHRMSNNLISYIMIGLWVICIGFCIFETVARILTIRKQKKLKSADNVRSEPMSSESSIITKNESNSSSLEPILPWFGDLMILLLSSAIGIAGILMVINNNQPVSFRIEEKYVAQADIIYTEIEIHDYTYDYTIDHERHRSSKTQKIPVAYYYIFVADNNNIIGSTKKYEVDAETYFRFTEDYEPAYVAMIDTNQSVISAWNKSDYLYVGKYLKS